LAGAIAAVLSQPSSHEKIRQGDYEARLLVNPAPSYSNAGQAASMGSPYPVLWLKSNTGEADLIYIYESPPGPGMVDWPKLYTAREYLEGRRETVSILGTVLDASGKPVANTQLSFRIEPLGWASATTDAKGSTLKLSRYWVEAATTISILGGDETQRRMRSDPQAVKLVRGQENKLAEPLRLRPPASPAPTGSAPAASSPAADPTVAKPGK